MVQKQLSITDYEYIKAIALTWIDPELCCPKKLVNKKIQSKRAPFQIKIMRKSVLAYDASTVYATYFN